jgi:hypothetical protein
VPLRLHVIYASKSKQLSYLKYHIPRLKRG